MSAQQVLFDAPGPRARRNILIGNIVGVLVGLGILAWIISTLAEKGQLEASMWTPFLESRTWEFFILPGLVNTLKVSAVAIAGAFLIGLVLGARTFSQQGLFLLGGMLADRFGPRALIVAGCAVRVAGYLGLAAADAVASGPAPAARTSTPPTGA